MKARFNKDNVTTHIWHLISYYETKWGFDPDNGYAQVEKAGFHKVMAYGAYAELLDLVADLQNGNLEAAS
jgi:hypothetical protein